jgi:hypothetical protein
MDAAKNAISINILTAKNIIQHNNYKRFPINSFAKNVTTDAAKKIVLINILTAKNIIQPIYN